MKQAEKIICVLIIILVIVRLTITFPYNDILIIFLVIFLSVLYGWFSFALLNSIRLRNIFKKDSYRGISALRILGGVLTGFILSFICIYSLFKFQRWPYADLGLKITLLGLLPLLAIVVYKFTISKKSYYSSFLIRLLIFGTIGIVFYLVSTETILEIRNRKFPEYIEAEKKLLKDPNNIELQKKAREERMKR